MDITILGIESSCDDTSAAVIRNTTLLSNVIASQAVHVKYGGVIPELASRAHQQNIIPVVDTALKEAGVTADKIDAIAFTRGPGLLGSLLVGTSFAKGLAIANNIPMVEVNHLQGHILSHFVDLPDRELPHPSYPFLCLLVSGGHTQIVKVSSPLEMEIIGTTIDDAAGEAFDKIARVLGLGYPGGPKIDALAKEGNPHAVEFPRVKMAEDSLDFSFSGVKTAVINHIHKLDQKGEGYNKADIAASFQEAVCDALVSHTIEAANRKNLKTIVIAGGVASNSALREKMTTEAQKRGIDVLYPPPVLCTDNAVMIASAGYYEYISGVRADMRLNAVASLPLEGGK